MITQALVIAKPGDPFKYEDVDIDDANLRDDEVLVEMKYTGVCHTDLNFSKERSVEGLFPAVFGHEGELSRPWSYLWDGLFLFFSLQHPTAGLEVLGSNHVLSTRDSGRTIEVDARLGAKVPPRRPSLLQFGPLD